LINVPGRAVEGTLAGSVWLSACRLAVKLSDGCDVDEPELSARSEAINPDMVETKSCFETLPVPLGSSLAKIAAAPCCWNTAGGFCVWKACSNWDCVMLPEPLMSIESNRLDIFCWGGAPVLAPETAWSPEEEEIGEMFTARSLKVFEFKIIRAKRP